MRPPSEHVHWLFATGFLILGLCLLGEAIVGTDVWRRRQWRARLHRCQRDLRRPGLAAPLDPAAAAGVEILTQVK